MIPILKINEDFFTQIIDKKTYDYFRKHQDPLKFADNSIPIYRSHADLHVGKDNLFNEFKRTNLTDDYGYCPTEESLIKYLQKYVDDPNNNFLIQVNLVDVDYVQEFQHFIDNYGNQTNYDFYEYVDEFGMPDIEYERNLIHYVIYKLENYD